MGVPGEPQLVAITVARDLRQSTFTFETSHHATASFAQNWLAKRGCPLERIALRGGEYIEPADDLTVQVEQQIQKSGTRHEALDTYTSDYDPSEAWTLVIDSQATQAPVRLYYEEWNHDAGTYTTSTSLRPGWTSAANRCPSLRSTATTTVLSSGPASPASLSPGQPVPLRHRRPVSTRPARQRRFRSSARSRGGGCEPRPLHLRRAP